MFKAIIFGRLVCAKSCALVVLFAVLCGKSFAGIEVELDVTFPDSTRHPQFLYVLGFESEANADTLAVFDSLSFTGHHQISLFFTVPHKQEIQLVTVVNGDDQGTESRLFKVSFWRTTFVVSIDEYQIDVMLKDYLYPQKNEDDYSYFWFLLIFVVVKTFIAVIFLVLRKMPKRLIPISSGTFMLSAFIDWFIPLNYVIRFLITTLVEFLLIALVGHKSISWLQTALLIIIVNVVGFGLIFIAYFGYVFW